MKELPPAEEEEEEDVEEEQDQEQEAEKKEDDDDEHRNAKPGLEESGGSTSINYTQLRRVTDDSQEAKGKKHLLLKTVTETTFSHDATRWRTSHIKEASCLQSLHHHAHDHKSWILRDPETKCVLDSSAFR